MKIPHSPLALACTIVLLAACSPDEGSPATNATTSIPDGHSSRSSLDWAGTYSGVMPCADCPGIRTTVHLGNDGSFERTLVYIDRSPLPEVETGSFSWNDAGSIVILESVDGGTQQYQVGENRLFHLDRDGKRISGAHENQHVLDKHVGDPSIEGKRWRLSELRGAPVEGGAGTPQAFFILSVEETTASGNTSCNSFNGTYAIKVGNRISFGENMAMTMMACPDMATEQAFLEALRSADNYALEGDVLSLNRARMAPLARFELAGEEEP